MSDNKYNSIEDRGWNQMRSVLDKEMPVKSRKGFVLLWFFFGSIALATLLLWSMKHFSSTRDIVVLTDESGIAEKAELADEDNSISSLGFTKEPVKGNDKQDKNALLEAEDYKELKNSKVFQAKSGDEILNNKKEKEINILSKQSKASKKPESIISKKMVEEFHGAEESTGEGEPVIRQTTDMTLPKITDEKNTFLDNLETYDDALDASEFMLAKNESENKSMARSLFASPFKIAPSFPTSLKWSSEASLGKKPIIAIRHPNTFTPYIVATMNFQSKAHDLGYGIGMGLNYGNNNLEMYLESSYLRSTYNSGTTTDELERDASISEVENNPTGVSGGFNTMSEIGIEVTNFSNLTAHTDELRFDVGLRKRLNNKIKIDVGVSYSRLLRAQNKLLFIEFDSGLIADAGNNVYVLGTTELYDSRLYAPFDILPHIGLEYGVTKNLFINLQYSYGLKNLISANQLENISSLSSKDEIYRRTVGLKLRYNF